MKTLRFLLATMLVSICMYTSAQSYDTTQYYGKMDYIFQYVNKAPITTGILLDYGMDFINQSNYTGVALHDSNYVGMAEWRIIYAGLYSAQVTNAGLPALSAINSAIESYNTADKPVSFVGMHYNYQQLRDDAITGNMMTVSNDHLYDVVNRTQNPFSATEAFAFAPIRQAIFTGATSFIFRRDLFYTNTGKTVSGIAIDANGGSNYQVVSWDVPFTLSYATTGYKPVSIRITYTDGTVRYSHTKLAVYQGSDAAPMGAGMLGVLQFGEYGGGKRIVINTEKVATKAYLGTTGTAIIDVQLSVSNTTGAIRKPLIVISGFDPVGSIDFKYFTNNLKFDNSKAPINIQPITLNYGLDDINQYDIITVRWKNGTDYIQRNAYALEKVIDFVNTSKTTWNGARQQNVLIGMSMGGLVVRYALRDMELNNQPHETRLFISHDAPHNGANVPVAAQLAVQHFASLHLGPAFNYTDLVPQAAEALKIFNSPAAKQMLIQRYLLGAGDKAIADNSAFNSFMNEINSMGWPVNCRTVTLSNGSCSGTKIFPDNSDMFIITGDQGIPYLLSLWSSFYLSIAASPVAADLIYGSSFNTWAIFTQLPLSIFSTSTKVKTDFAIRAVPPSGTKEIYRGDVYVKRKILWAINVNSYIIKCRVNSTSEMLPLDNAPGGMYNMNQFGFDINELQKSLPEFLKIRKDIVKQENFCFVPTSSALALGNVKNNLFSAICESASCQKPSGVSDYYAPQQNQFHISYTQASSDWLLYQQDPTANCARTCNNTPLSISGDYGICGTSIYKVEGLTGSGSCNKVQWTLETSGPTLELTSNVDGTATIVNKRYYGTTGILKAFVNGVTLTKEVKTAGGLSVSGTIEQEGCYNQQRLKLDLITGYPNTTPNFVFGGYCPIYVYIKTSSQINVSLFNGYTVSDWYFSKNTNGGGLLYFKFLTGPVFFDITEVGASSDCGKVKMLFMARSDSKQPSGKMTMVLSPNPAANSLTVALNTEDNKVGAQSEGHALLQSASAMQKASVKPENGITKPLANSNTAQEKMDVHISDMMGRLVIKQQIPGNTQQIQVNTSLLSNGMYVVQVYKNGQLIESKPLMIRK